MMFRKVSQLKRFGIFRDFSWANETPEFARFNLIYGPNKSGKTTLSRVFATCERKSKEHETYPKTGEFEITTESSSITHNNCHNIAEQVKVFNHDFVSDNVSFDPNKSSKSIVYISKVDKEREEKLRNLRANEKQLSSDFEKAREKKNDKETNEESFRISTALFIKESLGDLKISNDEYRNYHKGKLDSIIREKGFESFKKLSSDDLKNKQEVSRSQKLKRQNFINELNLECQIGDEIIKTLGDINRKISDILQEEVVVDIIKRFKENARLGDWAEKGFHIHKDMEEYQKCLFCDNVLPDGFIDLLSKHFNENYTNFKSQIAQFIESLEGFKQDILPDQNSDIHPDLRDSYIKTHTEMNRVVSELNNWIEGAVVELKRKHTDPLVIISKYADPGDLEERFNSAVSALNSIIQSHNDKSEKHEKGVSEAKKALEIHYIACSIEDQNYFKLKEDYESSIRKEEEAKKALDSNRKEIEDLERETSTIGPALNEINSILEEFLGRRELYLQVDEKKQGYVILRDNKIARNISEGEKTAIAFSYFIAKTQEKGSELSNSIIVIDDPVSSFDSNSLYHCFSLIGSRFLHVKQLIVSTHSFELFNLFKSYFESKNRRVELKNRKNRTNRPIPCEFFMIENVVDENDKRCASVVALEETLKKFKSEYHFLFYRLKQFVDPQSSNYADFYIIGNIARRFLEMYVGFKIPTGGDLRGKIDQLNVDGISVVEQNKVYKLIQEFSHGGSTPISGVRHINKDEIKDAVQIVMKMVAASDKKHFDSLEQSVNKA